MAPLRDLSVVSIWEKPNPNQIYPRVTDPEALWLAS